MKTIVYLQIATLCLTAALGRPTSAGERTSLPFHGSFQGAEGGEVVWPMLFAEGSGTGHATQLGFYTMTFEAIVDLSSGAGIGSGQFIAANGDVIFTEGSGQATPTAIPGVLLIVEQSAITGGTGRFVGATGTITITRWTEPELVDGKTISHGSFAGTIVLANGK